LLHAIKIEPNGTCTIYIGGVYEVEKAACGGAMRVDGTLYYVLKDHLGSASVVTDASGNEVGEQRYYPFGETRLTTGTISTDIWGWSDHVLLRPGSPCKIMVYFV
jgi:hypothetical protein